MQPPEINSPRLCGGLPTHKAQAQTATQSPRSANTPPKTPIFILTHFSNLGFAISVATNLGFPVFPALPSVQVAQFREDFLCKCSMQFSAYSVYFAVSVCGFWLRLCRAVFIAFFMAKQSVPIPGKFQPPLPPLPPVQNSGCCSPPSLRSLAPTKLSSEHGAPSVRIPWHFPHIFDSIFLTRSPFCFPSARSSSREASVSASSAASCSKFRVLAEPNKSSKLKVLLAA